VLSWIFDLTPAGIRRTAVFSPPRESTRAAGAGLSAGAAGQRAAGERYELLEQIGAGAMGIVYRARDRRLQREVALKFLSEHMCANPDAAARFLQEARAAAALNQANIMTLHAIEEDPARPYLVMELVEGETLEARLARRGTLDAAEASTCCFSTGCTSSVATAHCAGAG
jgi:serine/threonine protein kinase